MFQQAEILGYFFKIDNYSVLIIAIVAQFLSYHFQYSNEENISPFRILNWCFNFVNI